MSSKPGWVVVKNTRDSGKAWDARAWDPYAKRYRNKRCDTEGQANRWAKAEHARLRAGISQAGKAPIQDVVDDYLKELERSKAAPGFIIEQKRVLDSAVAAGVTDLRHPRVAAHARQWLADAKTVHENRKGRELSAATINRYLRAIRTVANLAVRQKKIYSNPFLEVASVAEPNRLKAIFTIDEMSRLVSDEHSKKDYWLPMVLLLYTGCRLGEMLHLRWEWIDLKAGRVFVRDWRDMDGANKTYRMKFKKERVIPLQQELADILLDRSNHQGWIISDTLRASSSRGHLSRFGTYVQSVLGGRLDADGNAIDVVGDRSPHSTRHSWISLMLASGENEIAIQMYAGHNELATTSGYARSQIIYRESAKEWETGTFKLRDGVKRPESIVPLPLSTGTNN